MCRKYEKHFLMFLKDKKSHFEENRNGEKHNKNKKKLQNHLMREISSSLQRSIEKTKNVSKALEAQKHYVRYKYS
jgi:hypothetical protein